MNRVPESELPHVREFSAALRRLADSVDRAASEGHDVPVEFFFANVAVKQLPRLAKEAGRLFGHIDKAAERDLAKATLSGLTD